MDLEQKSIERLKMASDMSIRYYGLPLVITVSGGKDSDVCLELAKRSGIPFEVQHSHTTVDAPQTAHHIRKLFYQLELSGVKCKIEYPFFKGKRITMWSLIPIKRFPPLRQKRYCCQILKETACRNRLLTTGVRWAESNQRKSRGELEAAGRRKADAVIFNDSLSDYEELTFNQGIVLNNDNHTKRQIIENCEMQAKTICNPIIDWSTESIWRFIRSEDISVNELYECGFSRVGCIGCPLSNKGRYKEFRMFPTYKKAYISAFDRMLENMSHKGNWKNGNDVFRWWMQDRNLDGQISLFNYEEE